MAPEPPPQFHAAAPDPRGWVRSGCAYRAVQPEGTWHRGVPSPFLTLIVTTDAPVVGSDGALDTLVAGLSPEVEMILMPRLQTGVQLAVHPLAARRLLGMPAAALVRRSVDLTAVAGSAGTRVREHAGDAGGPGGRLAAVRAFTDELAHRHTGRPGPRREVVGAWQLLEASRGRMRVDEVARRVGLGPRHLADLVRAELGVGPKGLGRVMRFTHASTLMATQVRAGRRPVLADVAARCGYADQAHLAREFRSFVGVPATAWLREELANLQAGGHAYAAEWAS